MYLAGNIKGLTDKLHFIAGITTVKNELVYESDALLRLKQLTRREYTDINNRLGLYLAPHPRFVEGDGLFLKRGDDISDGAGLLMGKNSPFKNIPVLGWLM